MSKLSTTLILIFLSSMLTGQSVSGGIAILKRLDNKSIGHRITIGYEQPIAKKHSLSLTLSHVNTSSKRNVEEEGFVLGIREHGNIVPYENPFFNWSNDSFSKLIIPERDDRYFWMPVQLEYSYILSERWKMGIGFIFSYKTETVISEIIRAEELSIGGSSPIKNRLIPVYTNSNYLDIGLGISGQYILNPGKDVQWSVISRLQYFPPTKDIAFSIGMQGSLFLGKAHFDSAQ